MKGNVFGEKFLKKRTQDIQSVVTSQWELMSDEAWYLPDDLEVIFVTYCSDYIVQKFTCYY